MRADRLLQILMLMQARGSITAAELARELAVSLRTIYRDIDALSVAGVPLFGEAGPGGGYRLVHGYRTQLTGLTDEEATAIGLISVPSAAAELGIAEALRRALTKVLASVPNFSDSPGERMRTRILVSPEPREADRAIPAGTAPLLATLQQAVLSNRLLKLSLRLPFALRVTHVVEPLGLVCERGVWYLVYRHGTVHVRPLSSIEDSAVLKDVFPTDPDFDLAEYWREVAEEWQRLQSSFAFEIRIAPCATSSARRALGSQLVPIGHPELDGLDQEPAEPGQRTRYPDPESWPRFRASAESLASARSSILSLGGAVEVLGPGELRASVADYARQAAARYP